MITDALLDKTIDINDITTLMQPSNEPRFSIDNNTREIHVPVEFKQNGISVVNDQMAEIIFFDVDRYYDITDLSTQEIAIYWNAPGAEQTGVTPALCPTCVSVDKNGKIVQDIEPDDENGSVVQNTESNDENSTTNNNIKQKIIFGWPITSEVTAAAGNLSFFVRFYTENKNGEKIYSLSTRETTVPIKATMKVSEQIEPIVNIDQLLAYRAGKIPDLIEPTLVANPSFSMPVSEVPEESDFDSGVYVYTFPKTLTVTFANNVDDIYYRWNSAEPFMNETIEGSSYQILADGIYSLEAFAKRGYYTSARYSGDDTFTVVGWPTLDNVSYNITKRGSNKATAELTGVPEGTLIEWKESKDSTTILGTGLSHSWTSEDEFMNGHLLGYAILSYTKYYKGMIMPEKDKKGNLKNPATLTLEIRVK